MNISISGATQSHQILNCFDVYRLQVELASRSLRLLKLSHKCPLLTCGPFCSSWCWSHWVWAVCLVQWKVLSHLFLTLNCSMLRNRTLQVRGTAYIEEKQQWQNHPATLLRHLYNLIYGLCKYVVYHTVSVCCMNYIGVACLLVVF